MVIYLIKETISLLIPRPTKVGPQIRAREAIVPANVPYAALQHSLRPFPVHNRRRMCETPPRSFHFQIGINLRHGKKSKTRRVQLVATDPEQALTRKDAAKAARAGAGKKAEPGKKSVAGKSGDQGKALRLRPRPARSAQPPRWPCMCPWPARENSPATFTSRPASPSGPRRSSRARTVRTELISVAGRHLRRRRSFQGGRKRPIPNISGFISSPVSTPRAWPSPDALRHRRKRGRRAEYLAGGVQGRLWPTQSRARCRSRPFRRRPDCTNRPMILGDWRAATSFAYMGGHDRIIFHPRTGT